MRWLVDGYNVIRSEPELRGKEQAGLDAARRALLALLAAVARRTGERFTVVFDGEPGRAAGSSSGQVESLFSRAPETADDVLLRLARQHGAGVIVVSSDRRVADGARKAGAAAVSAEAFLREAGTERGDDDASDNLPADPGKHGNPRRRSKDDRTTRRALDRLHRSL